MITKAYRFDTQDIQTIEEEYSLIEEVAFWFFDDNGEVTDGNALLLLEDDIDSTLSMLVEKYQVPSFPAVVFDNRDDADVQAQDGGVTCYFTAQDKYIVLL